ncbi:MAG: putative transporter [Deferribacteraceae bacterium]|jgi:putative transport protein|nr:putative transporter [Deferribacteraceae bacterium]
MYWLTSLFFTDSSVASGISHAIFIISLTIAIGVALGKLQFKGASLGSAWILFTGIVLSHFGMRINPAVLNFLKEFGLILFVYSIGLSVGPGFFSSFKRGGITLNLLAVSVVFLGVIITLAIHYVTSTPIPAMVGILCGAVTNTPGMGAAQQALEQAAGAADQNVAAGYAVAYPLAVLGVITAITAMKKIFKVNFKDEKKILENLENAKDAPRRVSLKITNSALDGKNVAEIHQLINRNFVITRYRRRNGDIETPSATTVLQKGDDLLIVTSVDAAPAILAFMGKETSEQWINAHTNLISKNVIITKPELNGKTITQTRIRSFGVNVTRIHRVGMDLVPNHYLHLQLGDGLQLVGTDSAVQKAEEKLGNSLKTLDEPNLFPIFLGITLGVIVGSIPFAFPGLPQPIKLGLAGGPLVVAILISRFGVTKLVTYTSAGANHIMRDMGISIFLACVGLSAGENFAAFLANGGYIWVLYGLIITLVPIFTVGFIGRLKFKLDFFTLTGLLSGSVTNPPALAYSGRISENNHPAVAYATVYPLTMFLRILSAQLIILIFI